MISVITTFGAISPIIWRQLSQVLPGNLMKQVVNTTSIYFLKNSPTWIGKMRKVRQAVYDMMNFWIDKGVGGFRMDVIDLIGKIPDDEITGMGLSCMTISMKWIKPLLAIRSINSGRNMGRNARNRQTLLSTWSWRVVHGLPVWTYQFVTWNLISQMGCHRPWQGEVKAVISKWQTDSR